MIHLLLVRSSPIQLPYTSFRSASFTVSAGDARSVVSALTSFFAPSHLALPRLPTIGAAALEDVPDVISGLGEGVLSLSGDSSNSSVGSRGDTSCSKGRRGTSVAIPVNEFFLFVKPVKTLAASFPPLVDDASMVITMSVPPYPWVYSECCATRHAYDFCRIDKKVLGPFFQYFLKLYRYHSWKIEVACGSSICSMMTAN
mmetsp:Transcript_11963/g.14239  ORF Transcript_11963/g.14239 Transcript_11963/m.14239 type:complete len:200 (+) Transcript_11963:2377-2976(+)